MPAVSRRARAPAPLRARELGDLCLSRRARAASTRSSGRCRAAADATCPHELARSASARGADQLARRARTPRIGARLGRARASAAKSRALVCDLRVRGRRAQHDEIVPDGVRIARLFAESLQAGYPYDMPAPSGREASRSARPRAGEDVQRDLRARARAAPRAREGRVADRLLEGHARRRARRSQSEEIVKAIRGRRGRVRLPHRRGLQGPRGGVATGRSRCSTSSPTTRSTRSCSSGRTTSARPTAAEKVYALLVKAMESSGLRPSRVTSSTTSSSSARCASATASSRFENMYFADEIRPTKAHRPGS